MKRYFVSIIRRGKLEIDAENREHLDEILFESSDDLIDDCLDYTDWEVMSEWDIPEPRLFEVHYNDRVAVEVMALDREDAIRKMKSGEHVDLRYEEVEVIEVIDKGEQQ
jgi:hypothetical protein